MRRTKAIDALARFVQCSPQYICMLHLAILAVFLCVHPTHATDEPISLIRQVDESTRLQHDFETEYEVLTFRRRPLADFDVFDELQEEPIMREQIRVVAHGRKLRQDLERTADQRRPYVISHIWDGTRLWILYPDERIVEVHSSPPRSVDLHVQGHYFNRIESRYRGEWATTIALSANEYTCETNGDAIRCRTNEVFAEGLFSGLSVKFVIQDRFAETPKMSSFTQHFTSKQSRPDLLHGQYGFEIVWQTTRWDNIDDVAMPASAEFRVTNPEELNNVSSPWVQSRAHYRRLSFRNLADDPPDPAMFQVILEPGMRVVDADLQLSFRVGERFLSYDGTIYLLEEPLLEHPGGRLLDLIRTAEPQEPPPDWAEQQDDLPGSRGDTSNESHYNALRVFGAAIAMGIIAFLLIRAVRRMGA